MSPRSECPVPLKWVWEKPTIVGSSHLYPAQRVYTSFWYLPFTLCGMVSVSGLTCTPPKGTHAPGKQCPMPEVPMNGSTYAEGCAPNAVVRDSASAMTIILL